METDALSDRIAFTCPACAQRFRIPQRLVRDGSAAACSYCAQPVIFSDKSTDPEIRKALIAARRFRRSQAQSRQQSCGASVPSALLLSTALGHNWPKRKAAPPSGGCAASNTNCAVSYRRSKDGLNTGLSQAA
jgi:hypothetical protein